MNLPAFVWHVAVTYPSAQVTHYHRPQSTNCTDEAEARAHADLARLLGGDVRIYRSALDWHQQSTPDNRA